MQLFPNLFGRKKTRTVRQRDARRLLMERLETRWVLADCFLGGGPGEVWRDDPANPKKSFVSVERSDDNGPGSCPMTDSVTITFRFFGDTVDGSFYGPAKEGVDFSTDNEHTVTLGPNVPNSDYKDNPNGYPYIPFYALPGAESPGGDRQMPVGMEIVSVDTHGSGVTYTWDQVDSNTVPGLNWPAGLVTQNAPPPPPDLLPTCSCSSEGDVRTADGASVVTSNGLASDANGTPLDVQTVWISAPGYDRGAPLGVGTSVGKQADAIQVDSDTLAIVTSPGTAEYFDRPDTTWQAHGFIQDTLAADGDDLVLTKPDGAQYRFYDYVSANGDLGGRLKNSTDADGNQTTLNYDSVTGQLLSLSRSSTVDGTTISEQLVYSYVPSTPNEEDLNEGEVGLITLQRQVGAGSPQPAGTIAYAYWPYGGTYGNQWDVRLATTSVGDNVTDTTYYRYYTQTDIDNSAPGYVHALKYVFHSDAYARLTAYGASLTPAKTPDELTDVEVAPYADNYFEYDPNTQQVTTEIVAGAGSSTSTTHTGQAIYTYSYATGSTGGYNSWATKFVEKLPDDNTSSGIVSENIIYSNSMGEVMLKAYHHSDSTSGDQYWATYNQYDDTYGRVVMTADEAAVTGGQSDWEQNSDLLGDTDGNLTLLSDTSGLITRTTYYPTDPPTGGAPGYVEKTTISHGETGSEILQSYQTYTSQLVGDTTVYFVAASYQYPTPTDDVDAADRLETLYSYDEFYTGTAQVRQQSITDPAEGTTVTVFDTFGRPIWTKDPYGFLNYTEYDQATGAVVKTIRDVDTTQGGFTDLPTNPTTWQTPSSGGAHLTTVYEVDPQGRTTKTTVVNPQAHDKVTYTVYLDAEHETRVYPGWDDSTNTTTGPIIVTREDREHGYTETLTMATTPHLDANDVPDGGEDIEGIKSLSRTYVNSAGQIIRRDDYFKVDPFNLTYSTDKYIGGPNTTYYTTTYDYDERGREIRTVRALDYSTAQTVSRTLYDSQGRAVSEWIGDDDTVTGDWSASNPGDMFKLRVSEYDEGGVGPGNLTSLTETVDHTASPVVTRTTTYEYDFRNQLTTKTLPDPDDNALTANTPVYVTQYDNLGRVTRQSDGAGQISTLGHYTTYDYDDENRTTTVTGPDADGSSGTTDDVPSTVTVTDARGLVSTQTDALGHVTTYEYDGAGRRVKVFPPDPTTGLKNPSLYTQYEYDAMGNITSMTDLLDHETTYEYDLAGRLSVMTQPDPDGVGTGLGAPTVSYGYDAAGNRYTLTDPNGNTTYWEYDPLGHVTSETNYLNAARNFEYDAAGRLFKKTDRLGRITRYEYNLFDQVIAEKWYESDDTTLDRTISSTYDDVGDLLSSDDPDAAHYDMVYDNLGRQTDETQSLASLTPSILYHSQYDVNGFRQSLGSTIGTTKDFITTYTPDNLQRPKSMVQEGQVGGDLVADKRIDFKYNLAGQFDTISRFADTAGSELALNSFYAYDDAGRLAQLTHSTDTTAPSSGWGASPLAGYQYTLDDAGRITSLDSYADGVTNYTLDNDNQLLAADHTGQSDELYSYDAAGNRTTTGYSTGTNNELSSDGTYNYAYDDEGNLILRTKISDGTYTQYTYDYRNRLTAVQNFDPSVATGTGWGWGTQSDSAPLVDGSTGEGTDWGWGSDSGQESYVTNPPCGDPGEDECVYWDFSASVASATEGDDVVVTITPGGSDDIDAQIWVEPVSADQNDFYTTNTWEGLFLPALQTTYVHIPTYDDGVPESTESFAIHLRVDSTDAEEFVIEADIFDTTTYSAQVSPALEGYPAQLTVSADTTVSFEYYVEDVTATQADNYSDPNFSNSLNWRSVPEGGIVQFPTSYLTSNDGTLSFAVHVRPMDNPDGELVLEADIFDQEDIEVQSVQYAYDYLNQLVRRTLDADGVGSGTATDEFFSNEHGQIVLQFNGTAASDLSHRYFWNPAAIDQLLIDESVTSLLSAGAVQYPLADQLGTLRDLASHDSGTHITTIDNHRQYDDFGNLVSESNSAIDQLFGYTGRALDDSTGLQNNLNRWFDSSIGRWMSEDPISFDGDPLNLYRYVGNSPTTAIDPSGEDFIAVADRNVVGTGVWGVGVGFHYSLQYWSCIASEEALGPPGATGYTKSYLESMGGREKQSVELLSDDSGWVATSFASATMTPKNDESVWISYLNYNNDKSWRVLPIYIGYYWGDRTNVAFKWYQKVIPTAATYKFVEPGKNIYPPFKNWPRSNYNMLGTNSNTFVRWLVASSGMTMKEIIGYHPGAWPPSINPPEGGGSFSPQAPPRRK